MRIAIDACIGCTTPNQRLHPIGQKRPAIGMIRNMDTSDVNVEELYRQAVDAMTPAQKFARMHVFLHWVRDLYERQLRSELGEVTDERLKWEVCRRLYYGDRRARELIENKLFDDQA